MFPFGGHPLGSNRLQQGWLSLFPDQPGYRRLIRHIGVAKKWYLTTRPLGSSWEKGWRKTGYLDGNRTQVLQVRRLTAYQLICGCLIWFRTAEVLIMGYYLAAAGVGEFAAACIWRLRFRAVRSRFTVWALAPLCRWHLGLTSGLVGGLARLCFASSRGRYTHIA